jgi:molybdopterin/thiamine biosynthesis adenylyltransferase/nitroreductase
LGVPDADPPAPAAPAARFSYDEAFSRNIGWITEWEQQSLRRKRVAIAGMGGVGGVHLLTLARLGIGAFSIADFDRFAIANFNRQIGATMSTIDRPKIDVMAAMARDINPELDIRKFPKGIDESNIDAFLDGVDLFVDGFDFFVLDIRAQVFARCAELGIPAITAAPLGMGTAFLIFMPGAMTFEQYFRLEGLSKEQQYANFFMGLVPAGLQRPYLMDPTRLDLAGKRGPSSATACQLCSGVTGIEAVKILLGRGPVRAAPYYHQFDGYRGKWVVGKLANGNAGWLQRLKLKAAYKGFAALSRTSWQPPSRDSGPEIEQILDLARWAPSGDNTQPWRFEITGEDRVTVHVRDHAADDVYDYDGGRPTLLSAGMLLESMRIAASGHGRLLWWQHAGSDGHDHRIEVEMAKAPGVAADPLLPFVHLRSVDRKPYRTTPLTPEQKQRLAAVLGDELEIIWHETDAERRHAAHINGLATDIRLRIPEAFKVHQRIIDWERKRSPDRIPAEAVGLDAMTLKGMRWGLKSWRRTVLMNSLPGGTFMARQQMDYRPGHASAAHFTILGKQAIVDGPDRAERLLKAGQAIQRFWLTATELGLAMQPAMAPVIFGFYGRRDVAFTADPKIRAQARTLAGVLAGTVPGDPERLVFRGRIGTPASRRVGPRSVRKPLEELTTLPR